jgi:hypothetical protein
MHKIKIIGAKCELITPENKIIKFGDLYNMVFYIKKHNIQILNPEILPDSFRELLDN